MLALPRCPMKRTNGHAVGMGYVWIGTLEHTAVVFSHRSGTLGTGKTEVLQEWKKRSTSGVPRPGRGHPAGGVPRARTCTQHYFTPGLNLTPTPVKHGKDSNKSPTLGSPRRLPARLCLPSPTSSPLITLE